MINDWAQILQNKEQQQEASKQTNDNDECTDDFLFYTTYHVSINDHARFRKKHDASRRLNRPWTIRAASSSARKASSC